MSRKTLLTADELERMPDDDSVLTELDEGELITMPPAGGDHGYYGSEILGILRDYVKQHSLGRIYTAETGFRLTTDTVRAPDVAFVCQNRIRSVHSEGFLKAPPTSLSKSSHPPATSDSSCAR